MNNLKLTRLERYWILYDVGNSAFILLVSTLLPIYFSSLAGNAGLSEVQYLAYWGYAASLSTLAVAVLGPILGTIADTKGYKKPIFLCFVLLGVFGCGALSLNLPWLGFLGVFVVAKVGYSSSLVFYDSMLADVTDEDRMDQVSSQGYAWGYLGSCIPFVVGLVLVLMREKLGISLETAMAAAFLLNGAWWFLMTLPLLKHYRQIHYVEPAKHPVRESFLRLLKTFLEIRKYKKVFLFLLSFFFYIDGVYTIIEMATAYGSALGLDSQGLLLALLVTQLVAFPSALVFGRLSVKFEAVKLIMVCIVAYAAIALYALQLDRQYEFWILAVFVGMFQGGIQALSRSYFAKIIPPEKAGEFFGLFDICGKGAAFLGTALMGVFAQLTGSPNGGVAILAVMFIIGLILFRISSRMEG